MPVPRGRDLDLTTDPSAFLIIQNRYREFLYPLTLIFLNIRILIYR